MLRLAVYRQTCRTLVATRQASPLVAIMTVPHIRGLKSSAFVCSEQVKRIGDVEQTETMVGDKKAYMHTMRGPEDMDREYRDKITEFGRTEEKPIMVQSAEDKVIVGCVCDELEGATVRWFYLEDTGVQTCNCGIYYKLERTETPNMYGRTMGISTAGQIAADPRRSEKSKSREIQKRTQAQERRRIESSLQTMAEEDPRREQLESILYNMESNNKPGIFSKIKGLFKRK